MKKQVENILQAGKEVFSKPRYVVFALFFAVLLYVFNATVFNWKLLFSLFSFKLLFNILFGIPQSMGSFAFASMTTLSLLGGIVLAMATFVIRRQISFNPTSGSGGIIVSVLAPSCTACAIGLASLLGIGGVIAILPFRGLEINILALILLLWTILYLSKKVVTGVCEVKKN